MDIGFVLVTRLLPGVMGTKKLHKDSSKSHTSKPGPTLKTKAGIEMLHCCKGKIQDDQEGDEKDPTQEFHKSCKI